MNKFNLYDLLGRLAAAATKKQEEKPKENSSPEIKSPENEPPPPAVLKSPDKRAVIEMIRKHDQKSRDIDERIKAQSKEDESRP